MSVGVTENHGVTEGGTGGVTEGVAGGGAEGVAGDVELTTLLVAAARAIETHRSDALARDHYAEHFVRASPAATHWPVHPRDVPDGEADPLWGRLGRYFALRTRAFDDQLLRAVQLGARQVVLLGAGLDARAYRLDWPGDCTTGPRCSPSRSGCWTGSKPQRPTGPPPTGWPSRPTSAPTGPGR